MRIILASKSPRRRELLENLGVNFEIEVPEADECFVCDSAEDTAKEISGRKGRIVRDKILSDGGIPESLLIIACDTLVYVNGQILGKPRGRQDAYRMLGLLSGKEHIVVSGVYLYHAGREVSASETTKVTFSKLSENIIEKYLACSEPYDKAGAYAVQGKASVFIEKIEGDFFNVVGLPVHLIYEIAKKEFGIELF